MKATVDDVKATEVGSTHGNLLVVCTATDLQWQATYSLDPRPFWPHEEGSGE